MNKYELIYESLQDRVNKGELSVADAERLNDLAYEKYVVAESKKDDDLAMIDDLRAKIDSGDVKLSKDCIEEIKELIGVEDDDKDEDDKEEAKEEEKASDDKQADENGEGAPAEEVTESEEVEEDEEFTEAAGNIFSKIKMKIEVSKLSKEDKDKVEALQKEYRDELEKIEETYQTAKDVLDGKMRRKMQKLDDAFNKKYSKIVNK